LRSKKHGPTQPPPSFCENNKPDPNRGYEILTIFESLQRNAEKPILDGLTTTEQDLLLHPPTECGASSEDVFSLLEMYLPIFDKVSFFDLFVSDDFNGLRVHQGSKSKPKDQHSFWRPSTRIISVNTETVDEPERGPRPQQIIDTLLHEMIRAFLWVYSCRCWSQECGAAWREGVGKTGHGPAWCYLMADMRLALQRDLGWDPDFKFLFSVVPERGRYKKNWGVTNWDLRRWGFRQVYAAKAGGRNENET
jgi:hypothetical protein